MGAATTLAIVTFLAWQFKKSRHQREYITLKHDARTLQALVVFPKSRDKASVVILVHEISRDPSPSKRAVYIWRTLAKVRRWAER